MSELEIFQNEEFGEVRVVEKNGEPWFIGNDIANALGYSNSRKAIGDHVEEEDRNTVTIRDGNRGNPEKTIINESGLYSLIMGSRLPNAKKFKKWVTSEVLPSIRKTGGYIVNQEQMSPEELVAQALVVANNIIEEKKKENIKLQAKIVRDQPKVEFYNTVIDSDGAMSMNDAVKTLGIPYFGRTKLFKYLRDRKVLDRNNVPYQKYIDAKWFNVTETSYITDWGVHVNRTTRVHQKGLDGIRRALKKDGYFNKE